MKKVKRRDFIKTVAMGASISLIPGKRALADLFNPSNTNQSASNFFVESLSGDWAFQFDPSDAGVREAWFLKNLADKIQLPNSTATGGKGPIIQQSEHGMFTPLRRYIGSAWYQRQIEIPDTWKNRKVILHLERVLWRSTVWVDGQKIGAPVDFLGIPHEHDLGVLSVGKHTITIEIDNRQIHQIGAKGHHYYEGMQTIWNGIVGKIELTSVPLVYIELARFFPSYKDGNVEVELNIKNNSANDQPEKVKVEIHEKATGSPLAKCEIPMIAKRGTNQIRQKIALSSRPKEWSEFSPNLYTAKASIGSGTETHEYQADIGFRDLGKKDYHLTINERPLFLRSNHDGCIFPLTGYPPADVESWKRVLKIYKDHGLNGIRFHSWTPPEAAFIAADELGIYIQSEHFWCNLDFDADTQNFARKEMKACLDRYGNHPSMCYVLYGNELGGDLQEYGKWINEDRKYDPRHCYSVAAGRRVPAADDFSEYGAKMNWSAPFTDWNYSGYFLKYQNKGIPETTHELGQPATHPNWLELDKYTGVLKPRNLEAFRDAARAVGVEDQSAQFQKASGNLNRINYKYDIEGLLRTPESGGYGLLDMHDYPGQGEALVGWLDSFYEEKGFLTAEEFRQYGSATVPLVRLPKFVFTDGEPLNAAAEIAHYGAAPLVAAVLHWSLQNEDGKLVANGDLPPKEIPVGGVTRLGEFSTPLSALSARGTKLKLKFTIKNTPYSNSWDIWIFPKAGIVPEPANILVVSDADEAIKALDRGGKVLLVANKLGKKILNTFATFKPPFWSAGYFHGGASAVEGAVIQNHHPALALFPTDDVLDWQWQPLCADARDYVQNPTAAWSSNRVFDDAHGFDISDFPAIYRPIVQPVCDFHFPRKIGTVFEVRTKTGGRLMVCGYNIIDKLADSPSARQLRHSLLTYMASDAFAPKQEVDNAWILNTFENADKPIPMPAGFESAILYIKAGGHLSPLEKGNIAWDREKDTFASVDPDKISYTVKCSGIWSDDKGSAWTGSEIRIEINTKTTVSGTLKVHFVDWNHAGRRGIVQSVDNQQQILGAHDDGKWLSFLIRREDSLDGKLFIDAKVTSGPNLMISEIALVP